MIAVDSSALLAILWREPDFERMAASVNAADPCILVSAVTVQETCTVLAGRVGDDRHWPILDEMLRELDADIVPHDRALALLARDAFLRFGKGRHTAALNLGDCASYALAKARGVPLLFKGRDFAQTDILPALPP